MELFRALASLCEAPASGLAPVSDALGIGPVASAEEYTELFVFELQPYASIYLGAEGMIGGPARELIAGFWRAVGAEQPPAEADHLATMLALYAHLSELEDDESDAVKKEGLRRARAGFLWEHLLTWLPVYLSKLENIAAPFYRKWGEILREALLAEADATAPALGAHAQLPLHLREAEGAVDPRAGGEVKDFLRFILSPVRSGMIVTRSDLRRAARELELGLRMGERAFILRALLAQEAEGVLAWLAREAENWSSIHGANRQRLGSTALFWQERAETTRQLLEELKASAREAV